MRLHRLACRLLGHRLDNAYPVLTCTRCTRSWGRPHPKDRP